MYRHFEFELGREALAYLIQKKQIQEINIPYYLCDVVRHTLYKEKCKIKYYHINDNFLPENNFEQNEYILYPNYFGVFRKNVDIMAKLYPNLIVDNAHAYYDKPVGYACFNAGHKFGYKKSILWVKDNMYKSNNIEYNLEEKRRRKEKFLILHKNLCNINLLKFDLPNDFSPFVYPCLLKNIESSDKLVSKLTSEGYNIYRYWNPLPKNYNEYKFYSRLVPIPI